ncbi:hypothetical protein SSX86_025850 [Deinandra increscens subsp. villosa]|uniref:RING-type domain-containing protein n=1 Tax=Deinandra increscens subsp. villosa TaxID=3103831 RepID=A0AAP0CF03_9ASTR
MSDSHVVERVGKILIVSIVLLSVVLILISLIHLYAKWFRYRREELNPTTNARSSRRRQEHQSGGVTVLRRGLSPSFLETLAVISFDPKGERLECAICLSEVGEGEKTRMLPKCDHGFHVECIDMWFYSNSTCPICRNPVEELLETAQEEEGESGDFPTNILFWGDETEVSILTSQLEEAPVLTANNSQRPSRPDVVIDIPIPVSGQTGDCDEDHKSPVSSRMRSITRILSDL